MSDAHVLAFAGIAVLLTVTPGADTMLVMRSVLARGLPAGLLTTLGICCGLLLHATLSAFGLSTIVVRSATAFEALKLAGAGYLIVLGLQSLRKALHQQVQHVDLPNTPPALRLAPHRRRAFLEGLLTNVLNPKVAVFYLAFLPQWIAPGAPILRTSLMLAGIHSILTALWLSCVTLALGRLRSTLVGPRLQRRLEAVSGAVLIALGARLALERR